jgi:hypothetical protein
MTEKRISYKILDGIPERKRPLGRPRRRWENSIPIDKEVEWESGPDSSGGLL